MSAWERGAVGAVKATICKDSLQWEISSQWPRNQCLGCCLATFPGIISYKSFGSHYVPNSKSILFDCNLLEWLEGRYCWQQHPQSSLCSAGHPGMCGEEQLCLKGPGGDTGSEAPAQDKNDVLSVGECMDLIRAHCLITVFIYTFTYYQRQREKSGKGTLVVNGFCLA